MRLWTIQSKSVYDILIKKGEYRCTPEKSECLEEFNFYRSYDWMNAQMEKRVCKKPAGIKYPVWAWHTFEGVHKKPDLRKSDFRFLREDSVCIEIEIPDSQVLLSNEEDWHMVLNDLFDAKYRNDLDFDSAYEWYESLSESEKQQVKEKSWECIFDTTESRYIQATFWELKKENIVKVWSVKARKNSTAC